MASGTPIQFDARNHTLVVLPGLGTILVLPLARVPLLRLEKQGTKIVLPNCAGHMMQMSPDFYSKGRRLGIIYNFGTASYQMQCSKLVLSGDCVVRNCAVPKF